MSLRVARNIFAGAVVVLLVLAAWAFWIEPGLLVTRHARLEIPRWRTNLRIAVISDLHIGSRRIGIGQLRKIVKRTNSESPELVVLLGDFVIGGPRGQRDPAAFVEPEQIAEQLKDLHAPLGVFAVLGNHDWWFDGDRVARGLTGAGITVLENRAVRIGSGTQGFWLGGMPIYGRATRTLRAHWGKRATSRSC